MGKKCRQTIGYYCIQRSIQDIDDRHTIKSYRASSKRFQVYCRDVAQINLAYLQVHPREVIQAYADYLVTAGYSPATVHTYLAPICKAMDVRMYEIDKPLRSIDTITRSRHQNQSITKP